MNLAVRYILFMPHVSVWQCALVAMALQCTSHLYVVLTLCFLSSFLLQTTSLIFVVEVALGTL